MANDRCEVCGQEVAIAGGIAGIWGGGGETGGMTLELGDGSEFFLCFACVERLPDEPGAADVTALDATDAGRESDSNSERRRGE